MDLRDTFSYLSGKYSARVECLRCHPVYLMVLLRIADYIHIEAERAPSTSLIVRSLRSPFSQGEWAIHQAIREVRKDESDVDAIFVDTKPTNIDTYLRIKQLLERLQRELDISWAVLGEVFSRSGVTTAEIRLRRVRSTLDDPQSFKTKVNYVPERFCFRTAGAPLLHKLVGGLYGHHPEVGVRELIQNSIDAVNELEFLRQQSPGAKSHCITEPQIRVSLEGSIEDGGYLTVEDYGIGMDEEILSDYFFCAGISFRDSDVWQRMFVEHGGPCVTRSGRFGVGVLAAFLLGCRIDVTTRHYRAQEGEALHFSASLDDDVIEVTKANRDQPGTTIRVALSAETYSDLEALNGIEWDWYRSARPSIARAINDKSDIPRVNPVSGLDEPLSDEWHRVTAKGYSDVTWTFGRAANLVCNGLTIGSSASSYGYHVTMHWGGHRKVDMTIPVRVPCVSVWDKKGNLPIDLQRFTIQDHKYPFANELLEDVTRDYCAFCLLFAPNSLSSLDPRDRTDPVRHYPGLADLLPSFKPATNWIYMKDGAAPLHLVNLSCITLNRVLVLLSFNRAMPLPALQIAEGDAVLLAYMDHTIAPLHMLPMALAHVLGNMPEKVMPHPQFFNRNDGVTILAREGLLNQFSDYQSGQVSFDTVKMSSVPVKCGTQDDTTIDMWRSGAMSSTTSLALPLSVLAAVAGGNYIYAEVLSPRMDLKLLSNAFTQTWQRVMPASVIPFDGVLRNILLSTAAAEIQDHIRKWDSLKLKGWGEIRRRFHRETAYNERL